MTTRVYWRTWSGLVYHAYAHRDCTRRLDDSNGKPYRYVALCKKRGTPTVGGTIAGRPEHHLRCKECERLEAKMRGGSRPPSDAVHPDMRGRF